MAWLSSNSLSPTDSLHADQLNSLANDIRNWGGNVNGGGYHLSNVIIDGYSPPGGGQAINSPAQVIPAAGDPSSQVWLDSTVGANSTPRWAFAKDGSNETGANAGSNFAIVRYSDTGLPLSGTPFAIRRSDGLVTLGAQQWTGPINGGGQTISNVVISGVLTDPTTTKGDLIVHGTAIARLAVGTDGQILIADSTQALGIKWAAAPATGVPTTRQVIAGAGLTGGGPLSADVTLSLGPGATPVGVWVNSALVGTRPVLNFIAGSGTIVSGVDNSGAGRVDVTITATGSGGGQPQTPWASDIQAAGFKLLNTGHVGIGTAAPAEALTVVGGAMKVTGTMTAFTPASVTLDVASGSARLLSVGADVATNGAFLFYSFRSDGSGAVIPFTVLANGNVGIGTASPVGRLQVMGQVTITGDQTGNGGLSQLTINGQTNTAKSLWLGFDTTANIGSIQAGISGVSWNPLILNGAGGYVATGGFVTVNGAAAPTAPLTVYVPYSEPTLTHASVSAAVWNTAGTALVLSLSGNSPFAASFQMRSSTADGSTAAMALNPLGGNVGIGTANPGGLLSLGTSVADSKLLLYDAATPYGFGIRSNQFLQYCAGSAAICFGVLSGATFTERMRIDATSGNVGIGTTTPPGQLTVSGAVPPGAFSTAGNLAGTLVVDDTSAAGAAGAAVVFSAGAGAWKFAAIKGYATNGGGNSQGDITFLTRRAPADAALTETLRVAYTGRVGIGQPSPAYALDVTGDVNITGTYRVNGTPIATGGSMFTNTRIGSRGIGTVYQNTTGKVLLVVITLSGGQGTAYVYCDANAAPSTIVANGPGGSALTFVFVVQPNFYYELLYQTNNGAIGIWAEYY